MSGEYQPVPVAAAKEIADNFGKGIVVILAVDQAHGLVHTTTYGSSEADKTVAALLGNHMAAQVSDLAQAKTFEDLPPHLRPNGCCGHRAACPNKKP